VLCYLFLPRYSRSFFIAEAENRPKSAHRYNVAEQQVIYKSEIERIWKAQFDSLSRKDEPQLTDDEDKKDIKKLPKQSSIRPDSHLYPNSGSPNAGPSTRPTPPLSRGSSIDRERDGSIGPDGSKSILRIRRLVSNLYYCPKQGKLSLIRLMGFGKLKSSAILL
jgi:transcription initiation factor TFIID subunit 1, fungi type